MRKVLKIIVIIFCFILCSVLNVHAWTGKVVGVSDGDTIKVIHDGKQTKIRLYGVDTPEKAQAFGQKAKHLTASLVAGRMVQVEPMTLDRYGRTVGIVYVNGMLLEAELVKAGMAWVYRRYCKKEPMCSSLKRFESEARQNRIGLWSDPQAQPPWEWRRGKRNKQKSVGVYHGNARSHVFHRPGCKYYNCENCTMIFSDRESAIQAGFRPCGACKP